MRTSDMIKSKFWRASDVQGRPPITLTISGVTEELVQKDIRCFLWFQEHLKGLRINKTIVRTLESAYGPDSDLWVGKRVRLSFDPSVEFGGRAVGGVKLETPPGVVYSATNGHAGWGGPPPTPAAPTGAPPPPVWDAQAGVWRTQAPIAAPAPSQEVPPPPVWNAATKQWEVVNPGTGEIKQPSSAAAQEAQGGTWGGAPTISDRVLGDGTSDWPKEDPEFGHPDIPF